MQHRPPLEILRQTVNKIKDKRQPTTRKSKKLNMKEIRKIIATPKERNRSSIQIDIKPTTQSQTRNINFKINRENKEIYIEITDPKGEFIRHIPVDKNNPIYIEVAKLSQSHLDMIFKGKS